MKTYCAGCPLLEQVYFSWSCVLVNEQLKKTPLGNIYSESCPLQSITYQKEDGKLTTFEPEKETELPLDAKYDHWM